MKTTNKKRRFIETFLLTSLLTIMLIPLVSGAIGLSTDYNTKFPITIAPGETKDIVFGRLQNTKDIDATLQIELIEGGEIATITSQKIDSFVVPAGTKNTEIKIRVSIPETAAEGTEDKITIKYTDITPLEGERMIGFTESKTISLPVLIQTSEKPAGISNLWAILVIVLILVIIVIIYFILKKKK